MQDDYSSHECKQYVSRKKWDQCFLFLKISNAAVIIGESARNAPLGQPCKWFHKHPAKRAIQRAYEDQLPMSNLRVAEVLL